MYKTDIDRQIQIDSDYNDILKSNRIHGNMKICTNVNPFFH